MRPGHLYPLAAAFGIAIGVTVLLVTVFTYLAGPISADLGIDQTTVQGALSAHLASLIIVLPLGGYFADRLGARRLIMLSAILYGGTIASIAVLVDSVTTLYVLFILAGFAGAGVAPTSFARVIVHRFDRHRGLALGLALSGGGLADILLPGIVQSAIEFGGWRAAFVALGLLAGTTGLCVGALSHEDRSRSEPPKTSSTNGTAVEQTVRDYSLRDALRSRTFWQMTVVFMLLGIVLSGSKSHFAAIWAEQGRDLGSLPLFQAGLGGSVIAGRLIGGIMMDRVPARFVGSAAALAGAVGLLLLSQDTTSGGLLIAAAIGLGLCTGAESDVVSYLCSRYFGLRNFARIYGMQAAFFLIGFALGPVVTAAAHEQYAFSILLPVGAGLLILSGTALAFVRGPESR